MSVTEPNDVQQKWVRAFNERDLEGLADLYEPAAAIVANTGAEPQWGQKAIRRILQELIAEEAWAEARTLKVIRAGEIAQLHSRWQLVSRDGVPLVSGAAVSVLRRQPGGDWRYVVNDLFGGEALFEGDRPVEDNVEGGAGGQLHILASC
jgi:uncharacterized protein (TIGR02246 family)